MLKVTLKNGVVVECETMKEYLEIIESQTNKKAQAPKQETKKIERPCYPLTKKETHKSATEIVLGILSNWKTLPPDIDMNNEQANIYEMLLNDLNATYIDYQERKLNKQTELQNLALKKLGLIILTFKTFISEKTAKKLYELTGASFSHHITKDNFLELIAYRNSLVTAANKGAK